MHIPENDASLPLPYKSAKGIEFGEKMKILTGLT